jgi:cell division protein FtsA
MIFRNMRKSNPISHSEIIAAIDIGSSKICCAIVRADSSESLNVIGVGHQSAKGLRNGNVIDMQDVELSILNSVHLAEQMAKETIRDVYINIPCCKSQTVAVDLSITGHSVDEADVRRLLSISRQVEQPQGQDPIHTIPTTYNIDGRKGIRDPRGMYGDSLGVNVHTIYAQTSNLRNLSTCISRCHLNVKSFVASPLAAGLATLVDDEMDLGTIIVDMGAGTTTIGVFFEGNIVHTDCIPIGGHHITSDIARVLSTPLSQAERLKTLYGSVLISTSDERDLVKVPQIGEVSDPPTNQIAKADLVRIIRPRVEETLELIKNHLSSKGISKRISNRIVLTGGASQLPGLVEMASAVLDKQMRSGRPLQNLGLPKSMSGPAFSGCAGLIAYAHLEKSEQVLSHSFAREANSFAGRMTSWIRENI